MKGFKLLFTWLLLTPHWSRFDIFWVVFQIAITVFVVSLPSTFLISTVVVVISLAFMSYSFGRRHQAEIDSKQAIETQKIALDTKRLLTECYIFETWYFRMAQDSEVPTRIHIHSRVCPN